MPKSPTEVPHVAFTQHRIGIRRNTQPEIAGPSSPVSLVALQDQSRLSAIDRDRGLGLAMFELSRSPTLTDENQVDVGRAQQLLETVERKGAADSPVYAALAVLAMARSSTSEAMQYAERVLHLEPHPSNARIDALRIMANIRFREQKFPEALIPLREVSAARRNARDWFYLGLCEQNCNNTQQALRALNRSLAIDPVQQGAHEAIAAIYQSLGRQTEANTHKKFAARIANDQQNSSPQKGR
ncbi:MAG: hypothetical protein ABGZ17_01755 [Planctomycetaceae bacterium]